MIEQNDGDSMLKELLKGSILKTPASNFTSELILRIAKQNQIKAKMRRNFLRQIYVLVFMAILGLTGWLYICTTYFRLLDILNFGSNISRQILNTPANFISLAYSIYYLLIPVAALLLIDLLYGNIRKTSRP